MMSRKDYEAIAETILRLPDPVSKERLVSELMACLADLNPWHFNGAKFEQVALAKADEV